MGLLVLVESGVYQPKGESQNGPLGSLSSPPELRQRSQVDE